MRRCSSPVSASAGAIVLAGIAGVFLYVSESLGSERLPLLLVSLLLGAIIPHDRASKSALILERILLVLGSVSVFVLSASGGLPAWAVLTLGIVCVWCYSSILSAIRTASALGSSAGDSTLLALIIAALLVAGGLFIRLRVGSFRQICVLLSVLFPSVLFGLLLNLEGLCVETGLGLRDRDDGRAVFDGQRKLRFYSLLKMSVPRFSLVLSTLTGLLSGFAAVCLSESDRPIRFLLGVALGILLMLLTAKTFSKGLRFLAGLLFTLCGSVLLAIYPDGGTANLVACVAFGLGIGGIAGSAGGWSVTASRTLRLLSGNADIPLFCVTSEVCLILGIGIGGLAGGQGLPLGWVALGYGIIGFFLMLVCSKALAGEPELDDYLEGGKDNPVVHEQLQRMMIRPTDAHKRPPLWLYLLAYLGVGPLCRFGHGMRVVKRTKIKGPALILTNHASNYDYLFIAAACWPVRINFLATYYWFTFRKLRPWLRYMGVIPKYQFATDITAMKKLRYITRHGGVTFVAPEGTVYANGKSGYISNAIVKMVRFLSVPVYTIKIEGAGLGQGKWQKVCQKGRVDVSMAPLFTAEEVRSLDSETMHKRIVQALDFDDFEFQRRTGVKIRGTTKAEGLDDLLFRCPDCGKEFTLKTEGNDIWCTSCSLRATINDDFRFDWVSGNCRFDNYSQWYDWQYQALSAEMEDPDWRLEAPVRYGIDIVDTDGYVDKGEGIISLSLKDGWVYTGTLLGEQVREHDTLSSVPVAIMKMGKHIELPFKKHSRRFAFTGDGRISQKFHVASRIITEKGLAGKYES